MIEREVTPHLPTSGQIIGALVARLGLKEPSLQSRTARRYFAGRLEELVKDKTEDEIIGDVARALSNSEPNPKPGRALSGAAGRKPPR